MYDLAGYKSGAIYFLNRHQNLVNLLIMFLFCCLHDLFMLPPPFNMLFSSRRTQSDDECFKNKGAVKLYSHS